MTEEEQRNIETAKRYIDLYNNDLERFVPECYTADLRVYAIGLGMIEGAELFLQAEQAVLDAAPKRYFRLERVAVSGDVVTNEVTLLDPDAGADWAIPFVGVWTMRDGKIAVDRTYADYTNWPGLDAVFPAGVESGGSRFPVGAIRI